MRRGPYLARLVQGIKCSSSRAFPHSCCVYRSLSLFMTQRWPRLLCRASQRQIPSRVGWSIRGETSPSSPSCTESSSSGGGLITKALNRPTVCCRRQFTNRFSAQPNVPYSRTPQQLPLGNRLLKQAFSGSMNFPSRVCGSNMSVHGVDNL